MGEQPRNFESIEGATENTVNVKELKVGEKYLFPDSFRINEKKSTIYIKPNTSFEIQEIDPYSDIFPQEKGGIIITEYIILDFNGVVLVVKKKKIEEIRIFRK